MGLVETTIDGQAILVRTVDSGGEGAFVKTGRNEMSSIPGLVGAVREQVGAAVREFGVLAETVGEALPPTELTLTIGGSIGGKGSLILFESEAKASVTLSMKITVGAQKHG